MSSGARGRSAEDDDEEDCHGVVFETSPDAFNRTEFGVVSGQEFQGHHTALRLDMLAYPLGATGLESIPDDKELAMRL